jgi:murein L,D-transpeptidase YcbB/YkuD
MKVSTEQVSAGAPRVERTSTALAGHGGAFTRRGVAMALFGAAAGIVCGPSLARAESPLQALQNYQLRAEWADRYDSAIADLNKVKGTQPTLSPMTAVQIERSIPVYQQIVARGGWPTLPEKVRLKLGSRDRAVATLRERLVISGDLVEAGGRSDTFDSYVDAAVRRFQVRHGLQPDGVVGGATVAAMNVPADLRLRQLELNLVRVRSMSGFLGERYVMVNIPSAEIEAVQGDIVRSRHTGVVGKIDRQSPILEAKIQEINFNPYWHVPESIIRKDLIPKMLADPQYLVKNRIRIYDGKNNELQATDIDWNTDQATQYLFRQEPGLENSMGSVKINFPNPHAVYMHDTPQKSLFGQNARFHSSGCVRVQNVRELVSWLLETNPEWPKSRIDEAIRTGERIDAKLQAPVPVYFNYITAWATQDGVVHFRDDIYQRDLGDAVAMNTAVIGGGEEAFYQLPQ